MTLDITWGELASTVWEAAVGDREITPPDQDVSGDGSNPLWQWVTDFLPEGIRDGVRALASRLSGWAIGSLLNVVKSIKQWGISTVTGFFLTSKSFMWNFNWNMSDSDYEEQFRQRRIALAAQLGSTVGCGFGWAAGMAFGVGVDLSMDAIAKGLGIPLLAFDKRAMKSALRDTTEEGLDEMAAMLGGLVKNASLYVLQWQFVFFYKNIRKFIKFWHGSSMPVGILPNGIREKIDQWGEENAEPWSLAIFTENKIEEIPWDGLRVFVENLLEEADECFIEAAYMYAASVDRYKQELLDTREAVMGVQAVVEITPDRDAPNEIITVSARDQVARGVIANALTTHQLVANRDVGQWVGQPVNEQMRQQAPTSTLSIRILYYPVATPPFTRDNFAIKGGDPDSWHTSDIAIPFVDPARLDWDKIKRAAGVQGRLFGRYRAYGYLGGRKLEVYGASESDAKAWIEELADLSEAPLIGLGFTRRDRNSASVSSLSTQFDSVRVFPAYAIITSQRKEIDKSLGRPTLQGNFTRQEERIELWTSDSPPFTSQILTELRKYHTPLEQLGVGFQRP